MLGGICHGKLEYPLVGYCLREEPGYIPLTKDNRDELVKVILISLRSSVMIFFKPELAVGQNDLLSLSLTYSYMEIMGS